MKIAYLSPLPPTRSGIAHYSAMVLRALGQRCAITPVVDSEASANEAAPLGAISIAGYAGRRDDFDVAVYQLGNNPHHEFVYREAMAHPGVAVLHDFVLHHLIVEMTLARGDAAAYVEALAQNHGAAGAAWARGRAAGLHNEMGNFLFPASLQVARRSRAVIVHNRYAADRLQAFGVGTPVEVVPHPCVSPAVDVDRDAARRGLGIAAAERVVAVFGFITSAKRIDVVLEAFAAARNAQPGLRLLLVGEPAPNIDLPGLAARFGLPASSWMATGYAPEESFERHIAAADRIVNLRYPSAGETSGALLRVMAVGKPVAVSDYAQFAEYPDDIATRIPFGPGEVAALARFLLSDLDEQAIASRQRSWIAAHASLQATADGYVRAFEPVAHGVPPQRAAIPAAISLFPRLAVESVDLRGDDERSRLHLRVRNAGAERIRTATWGQPEYRLLAKVIGGGQQIAGAWLRLPRDLDPGQMADLHLDLPGDCSGARLELYDALQGIAIPVARAWYAAELP
jgi:glycosyltransferase involved in cell wall biosynthesis